MALFSRASHLTSGIGLGLTSRVQDLKDFARQSGLDVVYSEVGRERDGTGSVSINDSAVAYVLIICADLSNMKQLPI